MAESQGMFFKITFILLGISSLIGWNAVLSSFHFFAVKYGDRVYNGFTAPLQLGNCMWGVAMPYISTKLSLLTRIAGGLTILSILLIFFPILAIIAPNDTGYIIALVMTYFIGSFNSIAQNSMIALAGAEGGSLNGLYWVATGLSGLSCAILSIILNAIFHSMGDDGELYSTIIFFVFASAISFTAIYLTFLYVKKKKAEEEQKLLAGGEDEEEQENNSSLQSDSQVIKDTKEGSIEDMSFFQKVKIAALHVKFIPIFIFLIYFLTFLVFPDVMMNQVQFTGFLHNENQLWGTQFLNLTYQIGDVAGKSLSGYQIFHKRQIQFPLVIARFAFIPLAIFVSQQTASFFANNWYPFVNMFLMASTNGFATGGLMAIAPSTGNGNGTIIETVMFMCAFGLTFGIAIGSFSAIPFKKAVQKS